MTTAASRPSSRLRLARAALAAGALAIVPMATAAMAQVDSDTTAQMQRFMEVFQRVKALYVEPVTDEKLIDGAIQGMLTSLDPHSAYLNQFDNENLRTQTDGKYGGLGLTVSLEDGAVKVIAPFEDSPADKAGIKPGDYITHLDGKLIVGGTLDEAVEEMRGEPGSTITLTIIRAGVDDPLIIPVTRQIVELKAVKWEVKDGVGIINLNGFSRDAADEVAKAIAGIKAQTGGKPLGYVLDLRSNPGGLLDQAIDVSDLFLTKGEIVSQRGRMRGENATYYAHPGDATGGAPMIVLIDVGSASASEIVAGALQDDHRAVIMGERSFGKGSVQTVIDLTPTTALRLTTARYYTPSGRSVQEGRDQARHPRAPADRSQLEEAAAHPRGGPAPPSGQRTAEGRERHRGRFEGRSALQDDRRRAEGEGHRGFPAHLRHRHAGAAAPRRHQGRRAVAG